MIKVGDKLVALLNMDLCKKQYLTKCKIYTITNILSSSFWIKCDDLLLRGFRINDATHVFITYNDWLALEREKQIKSVLDD